MSTRRGRAQPGYLNTDLEVRGRLPLDELISALGDKVSVSHHSRTRGRSFAYLLDRRGGLDRSPRDTLARWIAILKPLRGEARRVLRSSEATLSLGYEAKEASTSARVAPEDVAALARLGVGIEVVMYRYDRMKRAGKR